MVLQIGFSDEHISQASSEEAKLIDLRETEIDGEQYVVFYLVKDYQPRIINDFATIILVYRGSVDAIDEFVYRIELREPLTDNALESLQNATNLSSNLVLQRDFASGRFICRSNV